MRKLYSKVIKKSQFSSKKVAELKLLDLIHQISKNASMPRSELYNLLNKKLNTDLKIEDGEDEKFKSTSPKQVNSVVNKFLKGVGF